MSRSLTATEKHTVNSIVLQVTTKDKIDQVKEDVTKLLPSDAAARISSLQTQLATINSQATSLQADITSLNS
jgi:peptidoglycan hydrolase CwlO-like protein